MELEKWQKFLFQKVLKRKNKFYNVPNSEIRKSANTESFACTSDKLTKKIFGRNIRVSLLLNPLEKVLGFHRRHDEIYSIIFLIDTAS